MGNSQDMTEDRQELLRSALERCHTLFTYDVVTAMIPIAIFSGCAVTVVEDPEKEVCVPRNMTEEKLRSMYREDEALVEEQIKTFIRITQNV